MDPNDHLDLNVDKISRKKRKFRLIKVYMKGLRWRWFEHRHTAQDPRVEWTMTVDPLEDAINRMTAEPLGIKDVLC